MKEEFQQDFVDLGQNRSLSGVEGKT